MSETNDPWLGTTEAAKHIGLAPKYFRETFMFTAKNFPAPTRLSERGRRRWRKSELDTYLASRKEQAQ